ncbi:MAG TPA: hypothetical protein PLK77_15920, partial [Pyrinomonadaceae bacterium]|nr:hypothetical protein [Pyrinomonadaceae bacterium]
MLTSVAIGRLFVRNTVRPGQKRDRQEAWRSGALLVKEPPRAETRPSGSVAIGRVFVHNPSILCCPHLE